MPDWKVCIAQPISRLRNFGTSAHPDAQILKILLSDAQFENAARRKNDITQLFHAARGKMYYAIFYQAMRALQHLECTSEKINAKQTKCNRRQRSRWHFTCCHEQDTCTFT